MKQTGLKHNKQLEAGICLVLNNCLHSTTSELASALGAPYIKVAKTVRAMHHNEQLLLHPQYGYSLNPNYSHIIAIVVNNKNLLYRVYNLAGEVKEEGCAPVSGQTHILEMANLISEVRMRHNKPCLVQVGLPGSVMGGKLVYMNQSHYLVGSNVAEQLHFHCNLPVEVCNDVNAMAYGFYHTHIEASCRNQCMAYLFESHSGAGLGVVMNGHIMNGFSGFVGEMGNTWPRLTTLEDQVKSHIASVLSVLNPGFLVVGSEPAMQIAPDDIIPFLQTAFPSHSLPRFHFSELRYHTGGPVTRQFEEDYFNGLAALAIEKVMGSHTPGKPVNVLLPPISTAG